MRNEEWQSVCPLYPAVKSDGGSFWLELSYAYNAYDKGILTEPGGLGDQPMLYSFLMTTLGGAIQEERELKEEQDRAARDKGSGKRSLTEDYLNATGAGNALTGDTPKSSSSPDSMASVPGLIRPRKTIQRGT